MQDIQKVTSETMTFQGLFSIRNTAMNGIEDFVDDNGDIMGLKDMGHVYTSHWTPCKLI